MKSLACLLLLACAAAPTQEATKPVSDTIQETFEPAEPTAHHQWLQQLVGEWAMSTEATMGPDTEPVKFESTESVRSVGGLWVVAEGNGEISGQKMQTCMTLGYDEKQSAYIGTWIDSMQTHMWMYRGTLDASKKTLTLEAEGPSFDDPKKSAKYRDAITIESKDAKTLTSSVLGDDGKWTTFMTASYRRTK